MTERLIRFGFALIFLSSALPSDGHLDALYAEKLGKISFPISCAPAVQAPFERAVALLHSFWFDEADRQFQQVAEQDRQCAMAYWGEAMSDYRQLWSRPEESDLKYGWQAIQKAEAIGAKTQRERDYVEALAVFFRDYQHSDYDARTREYAARMEKLYRQYPEDHEAAAFYSLSLLTWTSDDDPLKNARTAIEILTKLFLQDPDHPGVAHYLIHAADDPRLAQLGLPAARRYAQIAPASPHALHMPSHIFARLGLWQEDIQSNLAAIAAVHQPSALHVGAEHEVHAMDFLEYAYLQIGEDDKAQAMVDGLRSAREQDMDTGLDGYLDRMRSHFPAMYALERHQWQEAVALQPPTGSDVENQVATFWARAIGAGHLRNEVAARDSVAKCEAVMEAARQGKHPYRATLMNASLEEARAWLFFAQGMTNNALTRLRAVADKQDSEGKGEVELPAREMLADMLMAADRPEEALNEYEQSLKIDPNRFNGLYGAGRAAEMTHQQQKAIAYYSQLLKNCAQSHSTRPELAHARTTVDKE